MTYKQRYHRAAVLERWADIYGGKRAIADWTRLEAARLRLAAELIKALHLEEIAGWTTDKIERLGWR